MIPKCSDDGSAMTMNLRSDNNFVEDEGWVEASIKYSDFINKRKNQKVLYYILTYLSLFIYNNVKKI